MTSGEPVPQPHSPQWNVQGMTGTRSEGNENTTDPIMSDDRSVLMFILVEPRMRSEEERFRTFQDWPSDAPVTAVDLAKAGFYFLGPGDKVRCFCCGGILRYWVHGDSPLGEHKRHFPTCSFVLGRNVGNVQQLPAPGSSDAVDGQLLSQLQRMTVDDQVVVGQAVYPEMEVEESRLTTFHNWPTGALVQPEVLARAGFFYTDATVISAQKSMNMIVEACTWKKVLWPGETNINLYRGDDKSKLWRPKGTAQDPKYLPPSVKHGGHGDNVKCFYCDGGLRNWEPGDDPWQEHAKWFPRCEFLLQTRGQQYVSNIQESYFNIGEPGSSGQSSIARDISSGHDQGRHQGSSSALLSPVVQTVLQMGFEAGLVESLVQTKYLLTGSHYTSVSDLVADVLQAEEEDRQGSEQTREAVERLSTTAGVDRTHSHVQEKVGDQSPEEQLRQLQEERTCKVCMDKLVSIVFIPCGHLVVCADCAASLRHCPICRAVIRGSVRAFMS